MKTGRMLVVLLFGICVVCLMASCKTQSMYAGGVLGATATGALTKTLIEGMRTGTISSIGQKGNTNYQIFSYMSPVDHRAFLEVIEKGETSIPRSWSNTASKRIFTAIPSLIYNPLHVPSRNPNNTFKNVNSLCRDAEISTIDHGKTIRELVTACRDSASFWVYR